ncbi:MULTISPECIES: hypothetical protein [Sulfolobaceae]|uniref:hypothetical protein n=1 Tax=Sulfolobaceae TaxID=118883 RepID=UPI00317869FA
MSFAEQITLHTTVKAEPPPQAPIITKYQRARTRERNRTILPNQAVVYYMSSFAQLGVNTINANQSQLLQQYEGIPSNITNLSPSVANEVITTASPQANITQPSPNVAIPTMQQTINTAASKTVILRAVYNGAGTPALPLPDQGTVLKSVMITNLDLSNPVYVNGILVPAQQTLAITPVDTQAQVDITSITINNPYNVTLNIVYEEEKA